MMVPTSDLVGHAIASGTAVAAFNVITLEHAEGIAAGAERAGLPAVLQISENAVKFRGRLAPLARATAEVARASSARLSLHLDHVTSFDLLRESADLEISSVMFDAAALAYADNVAATRRAAGWAHDRGMLVEAELGEIGGKDGAHAPGVRTDPSEAVEFVTATGVDALAVAVGSSHAMTERAAVLDVDLIRRLRDAVPVPLVLHGSSGVPEVALRSAVDAGIRKVNIGTILNVDFTGAVRAVLGDAAVVDPRVYLAPARERVATAVAHLLRVVAGDGR